ncbi:hypothetical protein [Rubellicoccus peritrichatus]|uniref:Uncharacterized protein n=1 Tax=Rubellicoccus peritrichatus TaxID=3080537 RepID=A0AAQ3LCH7_9BACT|nr:hypothetical protein [Puniceicoccus sp. CR14]WOO41350.1 hypothetical protein RZN69_22250 [Puniceicoccus sp. CR14]
MNPHNAGYGLAYGEYETSALLNLFEGVAYPFASSFTDLVGRSCAFLVLLKSACVASVIYLPP